MIRSIGMPSRVASIGLGVVVPRNVPRILSRLGIGVVGLGRDLPAVRRMYDEVAAVESAWCRASAPRQERPKSRLHQLMTELHARGLLHGFKSRG